MSLRGLGDSDVSAIVLRGRKLNATVQEAVTVADVERTIDGASTVSMSIRDPERELLRSGIFSRRIALNLDDLIFELVGLSKSGNELGVTFESAGVADLRRKKGPVLARAGTTTRTAFGRRLVNEVKWLKFQGEPGEATKRALAVGGKGQRNEKFWDALKELASERNWRCFESEGTIYFGSDDWLQQLTDPIVVGESDEGIIGIDFSYDAGKYASSATIEAEARLWQARPGVPVRIQGLGDLAEGVWLVERINRSLFSSRAMISLTRKVNELPEPEKDEDPLHDDTGGGQSSGTSSGGVKNGWQWPLGGAITGRFGDARSGHTHQGIDIDGETGNPVRAAREGHVTQSYLSTSYGNVVYVEHEGGFETRYAHLSSLDVRVGHRVTLSTVVGKVGNTGQSTGSHLHFEIRKNGVAVDPTRYLP